MGREVRIDAQADHISGFGEVDKVLRIIGEVDDADLVQTVDALLHDNVIVQRQMAGNVVLLIAFEEHLPVFGVR